MSKYINDDTRQTTQTHTHTT